MRRKLRLVDQMLHKATRMDYHYPFSFSHPSTLAFEAPF